MLRRARKEPQDKPPMITAMTRAQVGDQARERLFEELMRSTYRQAFAFAHRLTGNVAEAEDLVQETYVRAYRFFHRYDGFLEISFPFADQLVNRLVSLFHRYDEALPFINWLYRIMGNANIDSVRRRGRLKTSSLEQPSPQGTTTVEVPDHESTPDRSLLDGMMGEHVQKALVSMNAEFRTAVLLADVEGMAYEEIAEVMQTSVGTVRSRIHRGRKQLRSYLLKACPSLYGRLNHDL